MHAPAGFCLLQHAPAAPEGRDHYIDEFFVVHPYRRSGIGRAVVQAVCSERSGSWCVDMKARNRPAHAFWSTLTAEVGDGHVEEELMDGEFGPFYRIRFRIPYR